MMAAFAPTTWRLPQWIIAVGSVTAMALYDKVAERSGFLVYRKRL